jgi:hypothetical protein
MPASFDKLLIETCQWWSQFSNTLFITCAKEQVNVPQTLRQLHLRYVPLLQTSVSESGLGGTSSGVTREIVEGINKIVIYREKFQVSLEITRKFLSGNWQYWSNLRALQLPYCLVLVITYLSLLFCTFCVTFLLLHSRHPGGQKRATRYEYLLPYRSLHT